MTGGRRPGEDWLCEEQAPGVWFCLGVRRWLVRRRTPYQRLDLAETEAHGRVLALDGRFMLSERDEFFYHEMLVHPALLFHPLPRHVLIVGGGDGGALREVLRHPVERATLVEIDPEVIEVAKEWLPSVHQGAFSDPRVRVVTMPGEEFLPQHREEFDVILVDSTDPIGPGAALFREDFFRACREAATAASSPFRREALGSTPRSCGVWCTPSSPSFPRSSPTLGSCLFTPRGCGPTFWLRRVLPRLRSSPNDSRSAGSPHGTSAPRCSRRPPCSRPSSRSSFPHAPAPELFGHEPSLS